MMKLHTTLVATTAFRLTEREVEKHFKASEIIMKHNVAVVQSNNMRRCLHTRLNELPFVKSFSFDVRDGGYAIVVQWNYQQDNSQDNIEQMQQTIREYLMIANEKEK